MNEGILQGRGRIDKTHQKAYKHRAVPTKNLYQGAPVPENETANVPTQTWQQTIATKLLIPVLLSMILFNAMIALEIRETQQNMEKTLADLQILRTQKEEETAKAKADAEAAHAYAEIAKLGGEAAAGLKEGLKVQDAALRTERAKIRECLALRTQGEVIQCLKALDLPPP